MGYPRVLGVAWAYVAHTDSLFDSEVLRRYLRAYQEVASARRRPRAAGSMPLATMAAVASRFPATK